MKYFISNLFSIIATSFVYLIGGIDISFKTLCIIMILDYISGVISAIYNKKLNSKIGFKGILKKCIYIIVIILATLLDNLLGQSGAIRTVVIYFFVANDGISILENVAETNVTLPKKLIEVLEQLKKDNEL